MSIYDRVELMGLSWSEPFLRAHPGIKQALEAGEIEGVKFRFVGGEIEPGDTYIAERNAGLKLLTCRENVHEKSFIIPMETAYAYDTWECFKIELLLED